MRWMTSGMALAVLGCGEDFPPGLCAPLEVEATVYIGEREVVPICFEDPEGELLTIDASSSDASVVTVAAQRGSLTLEGVSVGEAVVTVTAADPAGQMNEGQIGVEVPNRAPEVDSLKIPQDIRLDDDVSTMEIDLSVYFSDPDGHPLTYEVESLNPSAVEVMVEGSILTLSRGDGFGDAGVGVVAMDEYGGSASAVIPVAIGGHRLVFRDEFDEIGNLWHAARHMDASVEDGRLHVRVNKRLEVGYFRRQEERRIRDWTLSLNIENRTDDMWGGLLLNFHDTEIPLVWFQYGGDASQGLIAGATEPTNFVAAVKLRERGWYTEWFGNYDAIEPGTAVNLSIKAVDGGFTIRVNEQEIMRMEAPYGFGSMPSVMSLVTISSYASPNRGWNEEGGTYIDWIELVGTPVEEEGR